MEYAPEYRACIIDDCQAMTALVSHTTSHSSHGYLLMHDASFGNTILGWFANLGVLARLHVCDQMHVMSNKGMAALVPSVPCTGYLQVVVMQLAHHAHSLYRPTKKQKTRSHRSLNTELKLRQAPHTCCPSALPYIAAFSGQSRRGKMTGTGRFSPLNLSKVTASSIFLSCFVSHHCSALRNTGKKVN